MKTNLTNWKSFIFGIIFLFIFFEYSTAQKIPKIVQQQFERIAEENNVEEIADDNYLQELNHFLTHPINLNNATAVELGRLKLLNALQIDNFISYRKLLGKLIDLHELQSVPGWNLNIIEQILPYVFISDISENKLKFSKRFFNGSNSLLTRYSQVLQKAKGYQFDSGTTKNHYLGSPAKLFLRYTYVNKNLLQYGFTASKDAGEQFFKGAQKKGFDLYSVHLFARNWGIFKSVAIGDFSVNLGQGLIQWQSMGTRKNAEVINIEKQSEWLRPYNSSGPVNFHRGLGLSMEHNHFQSMLFFSYRQLDAYEKTDSLGNDFVSSLQSSGYHRTASEIKRKNKLSQFTVGGGLAFNKEQFHFGWNILGYYFGTPIRKSPRLYNKYVFSGRVLLDNSLDYSFTWKNIHAFGEAAVDHEFHPAFISGMIISLAKTTDFSLLYRSISKSYHALYSTAFTENSLPINEKGFYAGIRMNIIDKLIFSGYSDIFSFTWVKYRVDKPSSGSDYFIQLNYAGIKNSKINARYRVPNKPGNFNPDHLPISPVITIPIQTLRTSFDYTPKESPFEIGIKGELITYNKNRQNAEKGFMTGIDIGYYPKTKPYFFTLSFKNFKTDGSNSKIYGFETDVLYNVAITGLSGNGNRVYLNLNYDFNNKLSFYFKYSNTFFPHKMSIGSGLDKIYDNHKSDIRFELIYKF